MCRPSDLTSKPSSAVGELKQMLRLGWPTSLQAITSLAGVQTSLLYLGHLPDGPVLVAAGGIGSMFCNVAGRSLLVGFQLGCIPLMSQAFGAGNHQRIGVLLQRQWLIHAVLICTVIAPLWACSGAILSSVGQPPGIVAYASRWVMLRVPALFGWSLFMGMQAYCISQRMPRTPAAILMLSQALLLALLPLYVYGFGLGFDGVPLALSTADLASGIASLLVPIVHPRLRNGWPRLRASWRPALQNWGEMLRLSLPSALMQWSEWWAWELNLFLSGLLCAPAAVASGIVSLNTPLGSANGSSVNVNGSWSGVGAAALNSSGFDMAAAASRLMAHSAAVEGSVTLAESATAKIGAADYCAPLEAYPILSTTMVLCFTTQIGFTIAAGARVGNLMGAGDVRGAKVTTLVAMGLALTIILLTCSVLLAVRGRLGYWYGLDAAAASLVERVVPYVALYVTVDVLGPGVANRVLNGLSKVVVPGIITFVAFYLVGIPFGVSVAFTGPRLGLVGLWMGLDVGMVTMVAGLLVYLFAVIDWEQASRQARERALGGLSTSSEGGLAAADGNARNHDEMAMATTPATKDGVD